MSEPKKPNGPAPEKQPKAAKVHPEPAKQSDVAEVPPIPAPGPLVAPPSTAALDSTPGSSAQTTSQVPRPAPEPTAKSWGWFGSRTGVAVAWILTAFGTIFGVWSFYAARDVREIAFYRQPSDAVIFAAGQASKLTTSFDGTQLDSDVSAAQVTLWNNGNRSIHGSDALKPFALELDPPARILDASIRGSSRDVIGIKLRPDDFSNGRAILDWRVLEPKDGATVQLIYVGKPGTSVRIAGVFEGATVRESVSSDPSSRNQRIRIFDGLGAGILMMSLLGLAKIWLDKRRKGRGRIVLFVAPILYTIGFLYIVVSVVSGDSIPKF